MKQLKLIFNQKEMSGVITVFSILLFVYPLFSVSSDNSAAIFYALFCAWLVIILLMFLISKTFSSDHSSDRPVNRAQEDDSV